MKLHFSDGLLCKSVIDSLKRWEFEVNPNSENDISPQGRMDMQLMAKRTKDKMNEVIMKNINQNTFKVNTLPDFVVNNRIAVSLNAVVH